MISTTQTDEVLKYLQAGNPLTSMEAISKFGVTRLSAIIYDLRADGYHILTTIMYTKNRYGHTSKYAQYKLIK